MKMKKLSAILLAAVMVFAMIPGLAFAAESDSSSEAYAARIVQLDSITSSRIAIAGAEYEVYNSEGSLIEKVKTDATGVATLSAKLPEGEYKIKNVTPPAGYAKSAAETKITLSKDELQNIKGVKTFSFVVTMSAIHGSIVLMDEEGAVIAESGSIFSVYDASGKLFETLVTNSQGVATFKKNVPYGTYTVKQTKAPTGYYLDRAAKTLGVSDANLKKESNGTYSFKMEAIQPEINAKLVVIDGETKSQIKESGMTFEIANEDGEVLWTLKTEYDGTVMFPEALPYGNYTIRPTKIAEGYWLNDKPVVFSVKESDIETLEEADDDTLEKGDHLYTCTFSAKPILGRVEVTITGKVMSGFKKAEKNEFEIVVPTYEDRVLEGVKLIVIAPEDIELNDEVRTEKDKEFGPEVSNKKGIASFGSLYLGTYNVKLSEVPTEYFLDKEAVVEAELDDGNQKADYVKTQVTMELAIRTVDIKGIVATGETMVSDGTNVTYEQDKLANAYFGLFAGEDFVIDNENKDVIAKDTLLDVAASCTEKGYAKFVGTYPLGKLYIKQLSAPRLYSAHEEVVVDVDLSSYTDNEAAEIKIMLENAHFENDIVKGTVSVTNKNADGDALTGASYAIFNEAGEQIAFGTIHAEGHSEGTGTNENAEVGETVGASDSSSESESSSSLVAFSADLIPGKYTFRQITAANGYSLDSKAYDFEINDNGDPVTFVTESAKSVYEFVNVDKDGNPQAGVEFTAYDKNGNEVAKAVSDENGVVRFEGFERGDYEIKQTSAAEGYKISNETINVKIDDKWNNEEENKEPAQFNGYKDYSWVYWLVGGVGAVALIAIVVAIAAKSKKKKGESKKD